jgi:hypothetical protein
MLTQMLAVAHTSQTPETLVDHCGHKKGKYKNNFPLTIIKMKE